MRAYSSSLSFQGDAPGTAPVFALKAGNFNASTTFAQIQMTCTAVDCDLGKEFATAFPTCDLHFDLDQTQASQLTETDPFQCWIKVGGWL